MRHVARSPLPRRFYSEIGQQRLSSRVSSSSRAVRGRSERFTSWTSQYRGWHRGLSEFQCFLTRRHTISCHRSLSLTWLAYWYLHRRSSAPDRRGLIYAVPKLPALRTADEVVSALEAAVAALDAEPVDGPASSPAAGSLVDIWNGFSRPAHLRPEGRGGSTTSTAQRYSSQIRLRYAEAAVPSSRFDAENQSDISAAHNSTSPSAHNIPTPPAASRSLPAGLLSSFKRAEAESSPDRPREEMVTRRREANNGPGTTLPNEGAPRKAFPMLKHKAARSDLKPRAKLPQGADSTSPSQHPACLQLGRPTAGPTIGRRPVSNDSLKIDVPTIRPDTTRQEKCIPQDTGSSMGARTSQDKSSQKDRILGSIDRVGEKFGHSAETPHGRYASTSHDKSPNKFPVLSRQKPTSAEASAPSCSSSKAPVTHHGSAVTSTNPNLRIPNPTIKTDDINPEEDSREMESRIAHNRLSSHSAHLVRAFAALTHRAFFPAKPSHPEQAPEQPKPQPQSCPNLPTQSRSSKQADVSARQRPAKSLQERAIRRQKGRGMVLEGLTVGDLRL